MRVEDTLHIDAPPELVWAVTEDVERWPEWTPTVTSVTRVDEGPFGPGSAARIRQPGLPETTWTVADLVPGKRFSWASRNLGMRMTASHELVPDETGTLNRLQVQVSGATAVLLWPLLRLAMRRALAQENRGLKERCEMLAKAQPRPQA